MYLENLLQTSDYQHFTELDNSNLIEFGIDFHTAYNYFLKQMGLNKKMIEFVDAVMQLNAQNQKQISDRDLADVMGCCKKTVSRTRKRFDKWQWENDISLVQIIEGELVRDLSKKDNKFRYEYTSYKILFGEILINAVFEAKNMKQYNKNRVKAIRSVIETKLQDLNGNYKTQKRKAKRVKGLDEQMETCRKQFKNLSKKVLALAEASRGSHLEFEVDNLHILLNKAFDELVAELATKKGKFYPNGKIQ